MKPQLTITNPINPPYVLFDIGGTNTRLGLSIDGKTISSYRVYPTPQDYTEGLTQFRNVLMQLTSDVRIGAVVGGVAGSLTPDKTTVYNAPHLKNWSGKNLGAAFKEISNCPVFLENDTALVGLGEATYGSGKGFKIVCYMTVSTGVNGVRVIDGKLDVSASGFEIGHQIINFDESKLGTGELEEYISGSSLSKRFNKDAIEITDEKVWDDTAKLLSLGIYNTILHWSPEIVVLGGSLMKKISLENTKKYLHDVLTIFPQTPIIDSASLGELGGLWGALSYVRK